MAKATKKTAKKAATKTAKKTAKKRGGKGKRYSDSLKKKVIAFVGQVNSEKGRGGVAAAAKKFGASPLSISNWLKRGGTGGAKRGRPAAGGGRDRLLGELTSLNRSIAQKRRELDGLEARFEKLKGAL